MTKLVIEDVVAENCVESTSDEMSFTFPPEALVGGEDDYCFYVTLGSSAFQPEPDDPDPTPMHQTLKSMVGKRVRVTVEVID